MHRRISPPSFEVASERSYRLSPRGRKSFHTVLEAGDMLDPSSGRRSRVRISRSHGDLGLCFEHPIKAGSIREQLQLKVEGNALRCDHLERSVINDAGRRVRYEEIVFGDTTVPLPAAVYPEVALPFLLSWQPFDGRTRDLYAWINDRFVARVEYQTRGETTLQLASGPRRAIAMLMYPDLNDWVRLGKVLTRLARPLVPKYRIWFSPTAPFEVLRFEGPYGPPGAPEVVMELDG